MKFSRFFRRTLSMSRDRAMQRVRAAIKLANTTNELTATVLRIWSDDTRVIHTGTNSDSHLTISVMALPTRQIRPVACGASLRPPTSNTLLFKTPTPTPLSVACVSTPQCDRRSRVAQHGFYARPRLRRWSIVWFADSFAPLSRSGLPRRGHRLFGNVISFW